MFLPRPVKLEESKGRWWTPFVNWMSYMGIAPESAKEDLVLVASGVDGTEKDTIRRHRGFVLLEDLKRASMRPTVYATDLSGVQPLWYSAERVAGLVSQEALLQVEPFEISKHSSTPDESLRGFVIRTRQVLRKNTDTASSNVLFTDPSATKPFIALVLLQGDETAEISSTSRFAFVVPLKPVSRWYMHDGVSTPASALPHYNDEAFPDFTPGDGSAATTPIYCEDKIGVGFNQRFLYIWSTTGEFEPVTLWYDPEYGSLLLAGEGKGQMSNRSLGFHWESHGVTLPKPARGTVGATNTGGLSLLNKSYDFAHRFVDSYRNRYSKLSDRLGYLFASLGNRREYGGTRYNTVADDTELSANYDSYFMYGTIGETVAAAGDVNGGTLHFIDYMAARGHRFPDRPQLYADLVAGGLFFNADMLNRVRLDSAVYTSPGFYDTVFCSDQSIANGTADSALHEPGDTPRKALGSIDLQGITVVASVDGQSGVDSGTGAGALVTRNTSSGYVTLRWSATNTLAQEVYPTPNTYITKIKSEAPTRLLQVGDFGFLVGDGRIIRIRSVGTSLEIIEILSGYYLVGDRAVTDARGILVGFFRDGCYAIDPVSGTPTAIDNVDRVIKELWADTLGSVILEYDTALNCVVALNSATGSLLQMFPQNEKVTCLESTPYRFLVSMRVRNTRRAILVTDSGRFVMFRAWENEDEEGSPNMTGGTWSLDDWDTPDRKWLLEVEAVDWSPALGGTLITVKDGPAQLPARDGAPTIAIGVDETDYFWKGQSIYRVDSSNYYGHRSTVLGWYRPLLGNPKLFVQNNVSGVFPVGSKIAYDPIPFAVMLGSLSAGPTGTGVSTGSQRRMVAQMNCITPWLTKTAPANLPLFEMGVIDMNDVRETEPQTLMGPWFPRSEESALRLSRRTLVPKTGTYDPDNATTGTGQIEPSGASGTLLYPYIRCFLTEPGFSLRELASHGIMSASEATVSGP